MWGKYGGVREECVRGRPINRSGFKAGPTLVKYREKNECNKECTDDGREIITREGNDKDMTTNQKGLMSG